VSTDRPLRKRTQFEEELERAREASVTRQAERAAAKASEPPPVSAGVPSQPGRPAVGSIIELPLPRIQITERGPGGRTVGRPTQAPTNTMPGAGQVRGRFADSQRPGGPKGARGQMGMKRPLPAGKKALKTNLTTPAEHKRIIKMEETIAVSELAHGMGVKATEVLKKLWSMGMVGVTINASIDFDTAALLASEFGFEVQNVAFQENAALGEAADAPEDLEPRAPVVTVMGHVDHGKTSLLDAIRHADVAAGEAGGITQHIGAYRVSTQGAGDVVFLDTPGHAAFTAMRARGAQATDLVILVVAADDGVMPQTIEAINHAKDAEVPIIVAVTKVDKPSANPERVRQQVSEQGLIPEAWGGDTMYVDVSAYTKVGIDKLLESIQLQAELLDLKANPKKLAKGIVVEAKLDRNRGPMATVLMQEGTLRVGDILVSGVAMGKVRAMLNDKGAAVSEAGPSMPVEVLGLDSVPEAGDVVNAVADEKNAKAVIENRRDARRKKELGSQSKVSLENILEKIQEGQSKELKIILKTDVQGSAEALKEALSKLSTEKVRVNVIQVGVGGITESDVNLAKAGGAVIIGFHVRPAGKASSLAEQEDVDIKLYDIIYEAIDDVKKAMVGLLAPIKREKPVGKIEIREVYTIPKIGTVAGSHVTEGKVSRQSLIRVVRENIQVFTGKLGSLKRFKDDVREVVSGYDCGLTIDGFQDIRVGDVLEAYEIVEEAATL
jgi:translation initiation factor IF-2